MLKIEISKQFKKSLKKYRNNKKVLQELDLVLGILVNGKPLPSKYKDHKLSGKLKSIRECHLRPDDLLLYFIVNDVDILKLYDIGTHSDILNM